MGESEKLQQLASFHCLRLVFSGLIQAPTLIIALDIVHYPIKSMSVLKLKIISMTCTLSQGCGMPFQCTSKTHLSILFSKTLTDYNCYILYNPVLCVTNTVFTYNVIWLKLVQCDCKLGSASLHFLIFPVLRAVLRLKSMQLV